MLTTSETPEVKTRPAETEPPCKPREGFFFKPYVQILLSIAFSALSQVFLKKGADQSVHASSEFVLGFAGLHSLWVWAGIACLISSLFSWLYSLRFLPLVIAFNLAGLTHVIVPLICWGYLGEKINALRWLGIAMVFAGVLIVAKPLIKMEEL